MPNMPTPKNTNGGDTPRAGAKRVQPLLPRCGTHRPHLCSSFELKLNERLYSSLQLSLPQPLAADSNSTLSWASACEVLAVIEPSRMLLHAELYYSALGAHICLFHCLSLYYYVLLHYHLLAVHNVHTLSQVLQVTAHAHALQVVDSLLGSGSSSGIVDARHSTLNVHTESHGSSTL